MRHVSPLTPATHLAWAQAAHSLLPLAGCYASAPLGPDLALQLPPLSAQARLYFTLAARLRAPLGALQPPFLGPTLAHGWACLHLTPFVAGWRSNMLAQLFRRGQRPAAPQAYATAPLLTLTPGAPVSPTWHTLAGIRAAEVARYLPPRLAPQTHSSHYLWLDRGFFFPHSPALSAYLAAPYRSFFYQHVPQHGLAPRRPLPFYRPSWPDRAAVGSAPAPAPALPVWRGLAPKLQPSRVTPFPLRRQTRLDLRFRARQLWRSGARRPTPASLLPSPRLARGAAAMTTRHRPAPRLSRGVPALTRLRTGALTTIQPHPARFFYLQRQAVAPSSARQHVRPGATRVRSVQAEPTLPQFRMKPGYATLWRRYRAELRTTLSLPFFRQRRLTNYLLGFRFVNGWSFLRTTELALHNVLSRTHLLPDPASLHLYLQQGRVFVNGRPAHSPFLQLYRGDFVQLPVSLAALLYCRGLAHLVATQQLAGLRYFFSHWPQLQHQGWRSRMRPHASRRILFLRGTYVDVPPYLEVDFMTQSAAVLYEPISLAQLNPAVTLTLPFLSLRLYNWKYIT